MPGCPCSAPTPSPKAAAAAAATAAATASGTAPPAGAPVDDAATASEMSTSAVDLGPTSGKELLVTAA